jgi:Protein of unknown function (DUF4236)
MGFRFYRRIPIAPGWRVNVSSAGVSTSVGRRGAWLTAGTSGVRTSVGIPGTGAYYVSQSRSGGGAIGLAVVLILLALLVKLLVLR